MVLTLQAGERELHTILREAKLPLDSKWEDVREKVKHDHRYPSHMRERDCEEIFDKYVFLVPLRECI